MGVAKIRKQSGRRRTILVLLVCIMFIYLNNSSFWARTMPKRPFLVAHRGVHQTFSLAGIQWDTNTAARIYEPEHGYLENTLPSIAAAFSAGADLVEFDLQLTKDGKFAVFHDHRLDYRTNGQGGVGDYTMAELKKLDIGYGYTADGGRTFPLRGTGVGLMPSLDEVLTAFPGRSFLIHLKSNQPQLGPLLVEYLRTLPPEQLNLLTFYGSDEPLDAIKRAFPHLRVMSKRTIIRAVLSYLMVGWTGYVPPAMQNTHLHLPFRYARWLWGWPHRFLQRMEKVNTRIILVLGDGRWSEGFDTETDLALLPPNYSGGIWTNRIERIGPLVKGEGQ